MQRTKHAQLIRKKARKKEWMPIKRTEHARLVRKKERKKERKRGCLNRARPAREKEKKIEKKIERKE